MNSVDRMIEGMLRVLTTGESASITIDVTKSDSGAKVKIRAFIKGQVLGD